MILLRKASNKGLNQLKCLILPLVVYLIFAVGSGFRFGKPATMFAILRQTVLPTLIAWAISSNQTMGVWDFTPGSVICLSGIIGGNIALKLGTNCIGLMFILIACTIVLSMVMFVLFNFLRIPSMVTGLGVLMMYETLSALLFNGGGVAIRGDISILGRSPYIFIVFIVGGLLTGNTFTRAQESTLMDYERAVDLTILPLEDYDRMTGESLTLEPGEAYLCCPRMAYTQPDIRIGELTYQIKGQLPSFGGFGADSANITTTIYLIVPDFDAAVNALRTQNTRYPVVVSWQYSFDSGSPDEAQIAFLRDMMGTFADNREGLVYASYTVESIASNREDFVGTYGSLFFLAILLSIVFLAAAVLILYYKQISEGYEDQARFEIMQRVGMTKTDIRKSINSQLLLVFFLPLLFAGLHLGFAFPFVHKMLMLFNLTNLKLLIGTTVVTFAIYAVFYTLVYRITSNSYYSIVAGAKEDAA